MKIHANWLRTTEAPAKAYTPNEPKPVQDGIEPRLCKSCKRGFIPANGGQIYCTEPNCVRDRATMRQQERRRLQQMMDDADQNRRTT